MTGQKNCALQVPLVFPYKVLGNFPKALYETARGTCSSRFFLSWIAEAWLQGGTLGDPWWTGNLKLKVCDIGVHDFWGLWHHGSLLAFIKKSLFFHKLAHVLTFCFHFVDNVTLNNEFFFGWKKESLAKVAPWRFGVTLSYVPLKITDLGSREVEKAYSFLSDNCMLTEVTLK